MKSVAANAVRLVVKVGSSLVTNEGQGLDHAALARHLKLSLYVTISRKVDLRRLVEDQKTRDRSVGRDEQAVKGQVHGDVIADPVRTTPHLVHRDRTVRSISDDGQLPDAHKEYKCL
jgi:hypothetical protein